MDHYHLPKDQAILVTQKALIFNDKGQLLILKNNLGLPESRKKWDFPGGLLEMDESLEEGLIREVLEEAGLEVEIGELVGVGDFWSRFEFEDRRVKKVRFVALAYKCRYLGGEVKLSYEHSQYRWATPEEVKKLKITILRNLH